MDSNYMDFGSDSDSEGEGAGMDCLDSDEEERLENAVLLKMMTAMPHSRTKKDRDVNDFEAEMEAELDRRALVVESEGGVEHQRSLSRSSSNTSLNKLSLLSPPVTAGSSKSTPKRKSSMKGGRGPSVEGDTPSKKSVRFSGDSSKQESAARAELDPSAATSSTEADTYDKIYFDSDEDESDGDKEEAKKAKRAKRAVLSNDDLLYDPESDAKDQAWVDKRRRKYCFSPTENAGSSSNPEPDSSTSSSEQKPKPLPNSDAVLNCPACFTTLCLDCQRHDFYTGQYRAMFVLNCVINKEESLRVPLKEQKGKGGKKTKQQQQQPSTPTFQSDSNDVFNPVKCQICNTQVAVYDTDEVYHFFNVLTSHT